jgi:hypothetical protein
MLDSAPVALYKAYLRSAANLRKASLKPIHSVLLVLSYQHAAIAQNV